MSVTSVFIHMCICGHSTCDRRYMMHDTHVQHARYHVCLFHCVTWVPKWMITAIQQYIGGVKVHLNTFFFYFFSLRVNFINDDKILKAHRLFEANQVLQMGHFCTS